MSGIDTALREQLIEVAARALTERMVLKGWLTKPEAQTRNNSELAAAVVDALGITDADPYCYRCNEYPEDDEGEHTFNIAAAAVSSRATTPGDE